MARPSHNVRPWTSLPAKTAGVLAVLVALVAAGGAWLYYSACEDWLRQAALDRARDLGEALSLAVEPDLRERRYVPLQKLLQDRVDQDRVVCAAVVNEQGHALASAGQAEGAWQNVLALPTERNVARQTGEDRIVLAQPVYRNDALYFQDRLLGAVRVLLDTSATARRLADVRRTLALLGLALVAAALPIGYLLVWRLFVRPVHRLVTVTDQLAEGDFNARWAQGRHDEIGVLGSAFNRMAGQIQVAREDLLEANRELESKVAQRTAELRTANDRLSEAIVEKEDLLRAVSHDLNAPLRNIDGMAATIERRFGPDLPGDVARRVERIRSNVRHQSDLIAELLELSRIRSRPQRRRLVDISEMVRRLAGTFEHELTQRGIALAVQADMPSLYVEPTRIRQAFQNLIDNAVKYMDRDGDGRIEIGYAEVDSEHRFRVRDNGPGIAESQQERIFQVFRRGQSAGAEGRGVGLSLVRSIAANHAGRAWVESAPGQGATFFLALSVANTRPPCRASLAAPATPSGSFRSPSDPSADTAEAAGSSKGEATSHD